MLPPPRAVGSSAERRTRRRTMDFARCLSSLVIVAVAVSGAACAKREDASAAAAPTPAPAPAPAPVAAVSASAATRPASVDTLFEQLGSTDASVRDAAEAALVEMGDAAAPALQELASNSPNPEVQRRARHALRRIGDAPFFRPTLVTLHLKKAAAGEVYRSL